MSILIKGMKMPKNCEDCWALDDFGDYPRCRITEEQRGYNFQIREKRMDKCPLVPVPEPHGRLIDADALKEAFCGNCFADEKPMECKSDPCMDMKIIMDAPTIIEEET